MYPATSIFVLLYLVAVGFAWTNRVGVETCERVGERAG